MINKKNTLFFKTNKRTLANRQIIGVNNKKYE